MHEVTVDGFWMDSHLVTAAEFRRFVRATKHVTVAERPLDPADYPDADPELLVPGSLVFRKTPGPVDLRDVEQLVALRTRRLLAATRRARDSDQRSRPPPRRACRLRGRRGIRGAGRERSCRPRRSGSSRPGRARRRRVRVGRRASCPRAAPIANTWQGEFPWQNLQHRRLRGNIAGRELPAERLRALRHDGQRLGVDGRLFRPHADAAASVADAARPCATRRGHVADATQLGR